MNHPANFIDRTGFVYTRLTALAYAGVDRFSRPMWLCKCECFNFVKACAKDLRAGKKKSCGCLQRDTLVQRNTKHGFAFRKHDNPEYRAWCKMRNRCLVEKSKDYPDYGGRGITVYDRWRYSFIDFLADMGLKPSPIHSLDRINNDGNYEPGNCRWATDLIQANNKRNNIMLTHNGKTQSISDWARERKFNRQTLYSRIYDSGWTITDALNANLRLW